jgi:hypothetical protein
MIDIADELGQLRRRHIIVREMRRNNIRDQGQQLGRLRFFAHLVFPSFLRV